MIDETTKFNRAKGYYNRVALAGNTDGAFKELVAFNKKADDLKNIMNEKYGPGTVKYGSEIKQPEIKTPQAIFEFSQRNPAAEGGRIPFGVGGMPYKIFGKDIDIPKIPGVQGPEQNKKSVEAGFKKLEKWLIDPTPENWVKTFGKNNAFNYQLRNYLQGTKDIGSVKGMDTAAKVFDAINIKSLLKPNQIQKILDLDTGGKGVSLKSKRAQTFGNQKYTMEETIDTIKNFQNGEQWLKKNSNPDAVDANGKNIYRKYANAINSMQAEQSKLGGFPFGDNSEKKLWSNLYRASYRGDRIEIVGDFADGNLPINKDGKVDWKMLDKKGVPAWKRVQFVDLEAPKNTSFTWGGDFEKGDLEKQIDNTFGKGFFKKSTAAYDTQIKTGSKRDFTVEGGGKTIKNNVKVKLLTAEALAENPKATKNQIDEYIKRKSPRFNITEVHHPEGVGVNPYNTEPTFRYANRALEREVMQPLKAGKINQAEAKIQIDKINKDIGPIRTKLDDGYYGNYKNTQKSIVEAGNKYVDYIDGKKNFVGFSSGFNTDLLMKDPAIQKIVNSEVGQKIANNLKKTARGTAGTLGKVFGVADILIGVLDYQNNISKNESPKVAFKNALQAASINIYKGGDRAVINEVKERFVKQGGDGKIFDQAIGLNKKDQEINDLIFANKKKADTFVQYAKAGRGTLTPNEENYKADYEVLKKNLNAEIAEKMSERDNMIESYKTNLQVSEAGAPIQIGGSEFFGQPFKDIKQSTMDRIEEQNKGSYDMQKRQVNYMSGNIGNWMLNNLITMSAQEKTELQKQINNMDERELYKFNLQRGMDPDNLIRFEDVLRYKTQFPELMGVNTTKYVNYDEKKAEGGITTLRSKYEYKK